MKAFTGMTVPSRRVAFALAALILSLLTVGVVSRTPLRHLLQVSPALAVLAVMWRGTGWGADAARPIFAFWLLLMAMLWMQLLGLFHFVNGSFSAVEIALTIAIGASGFAGLVLTLRAGSGSLARKLLLFAGLGLLQWLAFWTSMLPAVSRH